MASKCVKCGYMKEDCHDLTCPRCNSVMMFEGCGSCNKCAIQIFKKKKEK